MFDIYCKAQQNEIQSFELGLEAFISFRGVINPTEWCRCFIKWCKIVECLLIWRIRIRILGWPGIGFFQRKKETSQPIDHLLGVLATLQGWRALKGPFATIIATYCNYHQRNVIIRPMSSLRVFINVIMTCFHLPLWNHGFVDRVHLVALHQVPSIPPSTLAGLNVWFCGNQQ